MDRSMPGLPVYHQLPESTQTHFHWVGDAIQPSHPLVIPFSCPQSFPAVGSFQMSQLFVIRWPKYWSFSFNISPSNEHPGLISFRWTGWISLQSKGLSKSLLQHHSSKASINSYYLVDNNSYYLIELHIYFLFIILFSIFHIFDPKNIFL